MILLLLATVSSSAPPSTESALKLCRPVLARKAGGEIATIDVGSSRQSGSKELTITGRLTAFLGMGPPSPGSASAHHLIRSEYTFRCRVVRGAVRFASVAPIQ